MLPVNHSSSLVFFVLFLFFILCAFCATHSVHLLTFPLPLSKQGRNQLQSRAIRDMKQGFFLLTLLILGLQKHLIGKLIRNVIKMK